MHARTHARTHTHTHIHTQTKYCNPSLHYAPPRVNNTIKCADSCQIQAKPGDSRYTVYKSATKKLDNVDRIDVGIPTWEGSPPDSLSLSNDVISLKLRV